jgi:hypothetical protein
MIPENQVELLAIHWFQGTGWNDADGVVIALVGGAADGEAFRARAWRRETMPWQVRRRDAWIDPAFVRHAMEKVVA